jgi:hypothetical protein
MPDEQESQPPADPTGEFMAARRQWDADAVAGRPVGPRPRYEPPPAPDELALRAAADAEAWRRVEAYAKDRERRRGFR